MRSPIALCVALALLAPLAVGCGVQRKLKITEVQPNQIELYLDEPSNNRLDLRNMKLKWATTEPTSGEINLGIAGEIRGGQYFMIYELGSHTGSPAKRDFQSNIPGIAVQSGTFPGYSSDPGVSIGVTGKHYRTFGLIQDKVSDAVTFGTPPRPTAYGSFTEDHTLDDDKPVSGTSISRRYSGGAPVDTDHESDWSSRPQSPGVANP